MTNGDLIERIQGIIFNKSSCIYADSAEPDRIEEIKRAGFNILPADKSVKDGIDLMKRLQLKISKSSSNIIKEIRAYSWKKDKDKNVLDEPVKFKDHAMDAIRYAVFTHPTLRYGPLDNDSFGTDGERMTAEQRW
jgi:phage terminase large subunit